MEWLRLKSEEMKECGQYNSASGIVWICRISDRPEHLVELVNLPMRFIVHENSSNVMFSYVDNSLQ